MVVPKGSSFRYDIRKKITSVKFTHLEADGMQLAIYAGALGLCAALIVPILYGFLSRFLPASIKAASTVPTSYPTTLQGVLWSVVVWGVFLGAAIWLVSMIRPVGSAIRSEV